MKLSNTLLFLFTITLSSALHGKQQTIENLPEAAQQAGIPGISMVHIENGKVQQTVAYGMRDTENALRVTHSTVFEAASLSKPVFAYIVGRLVDKGELTLDTPLSELLKYERIENQEYAKMMTPRLVLSHQTGLPNWGGTPLTFNFEPGKRFNYSGEGYVYLQKALENKLGMSLQEIAQREVFTPLGMQHSAFSFTKEHVFELSRAHSRMDIASTRDLPSNNAASSLHTTATDYAKFISAFFAGNGLSQKTRNAMIQAQVKMPISWSNSSDVALTTNLAWSMGWGMVTDASSPVYWHWGDNGEFRAFVAYNAEEQTGLVYFANSANGLAISETVYMQTLPDLKPAIDWLGYAQYDAQGYQESRAGFLAEGKGDYAKALSLYKASLVKYPNNNMIKRKVSWFDKHIQAIENPALFTQKTAAPFIGQYGPRKVKFDGQRLIYQRKGGQEQQLIQISEAAFILPKVMNFELEFVLGDNEIAEKLVGRYGDDYSDENIRTK